MATANNGQIVDEFENSFQACLAALTNPDHFSVRDSEEIKTGVEQTIQRFLDLAKQMECFFLQKRLLLSVQKPEQIILEDISELKNELQRKDLLFQKYYEKIGQWQALLSDITGSPRPIPAPQVNSMGSLNPGMQVTQQVTQQGGGPMQQQVPHMSQMVNQTQQHHMLPPPQVGGQGVMSPQVMNMPPQVPQQQPGGMQQQGGIIPTPSSQMHPGQHMGGQMPPGQGGLQGPLAYLERTTSNIGMPEPRR